MKKILQLITTVICNVHYPLGIFSFVCILTFVGARCAFYHPQLRWMTFVVTVGIGIGLWLLSRRYFKSFLLSFTLSLSVIGTTFHGLSQRSTRGEFCRGTFTFEKVFHTDTSRMGGIGHLTLPDGRTFELYIHGPKKNKPLTLENLTPYGFAGYIKPLKNPFLGTDNFSFYLWSRGIRYHSSSGKLWAKPIAPSFFKRCQQSFFKALTTSDENISQVYRAILIGKKEVLSKDQLNHFFYTGTMHLFAVSGLHVGVVSAFLFFLLRLLCLPLPLRCVMTSLGVGLYAMVVGFSPSTIRATLMIFFILLAQIVQRPVDIRAAFFSTIGLTLLFNPFELWDVGFQLSYGVVASIIFIGVPLSYHYARQRNHVSSWQLTCIVSLSASGMSTVFSTYYWHLLCPWSFIANLLLIPLASLIVILGIASWLISFCIPPLLPFLAFCAKTCVFLLLQMVQWIEHLPGSNCTFSLSNVIFYILLLLFCLFVLYGLSDFNRIKHEN